MFFAYVLKSKRNKRLYYGCTNNLERRLGEHNNGQTKSLRYVRPLLEKGKGFSRAEKEENL